MAHAHSPLRARVKRLDAFQKAVGVDREEFAHHPPLEELEESRRSSWR